MDPEISILIITHNQRLLLERCLDSVLKQVIKVPYEIIISDDGAADGTEEYVKGLNATDRVLSNKNLLRLSWIHCNSEDCSPITSGHRIGWNRLTAYKQARGKCFVCVDADDFLIGTDLYQKEYEMLEVHPECSMVQTRTLRLNDGEGLDKVRSCFPYSEKLLNGAVFSLEEFLRHRLRGQFQSNMYRRRPQDDMERTFYLGRGFDDIYITYYHLQYGPMVFLDITGYVWVQYPTSDSHSLNSDDKKVLYGFIPLSLAILLKDSKYVFLRLGIRKLRGTIASTPVYPKLSEKGFLSCSKSKIFAFRFYGEKKHSMTSWFRFYIVWLLLLLMKRFRLESKFWLDMLYRAMV